MYVKNNILYFEPFDYLKKKKITARSFVELVGLNHFKKPGDALLSIFNVVKESVDPKWLRRGDFAENLVTAIYKRDGHNPVHYHPDDVGYDLFKNDPFFGGVIDIELPDEETLIEVKSKDLKNYNLIVSNPPLEEIFQGMFYAYKKHYRTFKMVWIFFDPETQEEIFNNKKPTTLKNLKKIENIYTVDYEKMSSLMEQARNMVNDFSVSRKIPLDQISPALLEKLKPRISRYE